MPPHERKGKIPRKLNLPPTQRQIPPNEQAIRSCNRCIAKKPNNKRCSNTTCQGGPFCQVHRELLQQLRVKTSKYGGKGLFADAKDPKATHSTVVFPKGSIIGLYEGERMTDTEANHIYGDWLMHYGTDGAFLFKPTTPGPNHYQDKQGNAVHEFTRKGRRLGQKEVYIDAARSNSGVLRYANDGDYQPGKPYPRNPVKCNAMFDHKWYEENGKLRNFMVVGAIRDIHHNEEILVRYGSVYWKAYEEDNYWRNAHPGKEPRWNRGRDDAGLYHPSRDENALKKRKTKNPPKYIKGLVPEPIQRKKVIFKPVRNKKR